MAMFNSRQPDQSWQLTPRHTWLDVGVLSLQGAYEVLTDLEYYKWRLESY
jgi:hypothetical protein